MVFDVTRRRWGAPLAAALLVLAAASAQAAPHNPRDQFLLAMQALRAGDAQRAASLFAHVYEEVRVPIALYGLGLSLRELGRDEEAARAFERYIEQADPERFGERVASAQAMLRELRPRDPPGRCALGDACLGPLLSVGLPRLLGVGAQLRASRHVALVAELRLSPALDYGAVELGGRSIDATLRLHPFGNAFFTTAGMSFEHLAGEATFRGVRVEGEADAVALVLGAGASGSAGFVLGFDTHLVLDLARSRIALRTADGTPPPAGVDIQAVLDRVRDEFAEHRGNPPLILQASIHLGYLF